MDISAISDWGGRLMFVGATMAATILMTTIVLTQAATRRGRTWHLLDAADRLRALGRFDEALAACGRALPGGTYDPRPAGRSHALPDDDL